jgi:hypothetical protein
MVWVVEGGGARFRAAVGGALFAPPPCRLARPCRKPTCAPNPQPTPQNQCFEPHPPPQKNKKVCRVLGADGLVYQDVDDLIATGRALNPGIGEVRGGGVMSV